MHRGSCPPDPRSAILTLVISDDWSVGGAAMLSMRTPEVAEIVTRMVSLRPTDLDETTFDDIRSVTADALGLAPLSGTGRTHGEPDEAIVAFSEQFAVDVSIIDDDLRTSFGVATEDGLYSATQMVFVADSGPRLRAVLDTVFGEDDWMDPPFAPVAELGPTIIALTKAVALVDFLDPLTTELIRLRAARTHGSRICIMRRSVAALEAGGNAAIYAQVDHFRNSELTDRAKAALALVDAIIWTPATIRAADLDLVRRHLTPDEALAVCLHTMVNSVSKILVALGSDAPVSERAIELFDISDDGSIVFP